MFTFRCLCAKPPNGSTFKVIREFATKVELKKKLPAELLCAYPEKLLRKKMKIPASMYLANPEAASIINTSIEPFLNRLPEQCNTAVELNPGVGLLTEKLLERTNRFKHIMLFESGEHFMPKLLEWQAQQPDRLSVKLADIVNMWKLVFQDKIDNGNRVANLLEGIPKTAYNDDPNAVLFGAVGSYHFFKHLINSLVFQNSLFNWGRFEMYLVMPPEIYVHLTCRQDIGYLFYRAISILFQMFFEYRFITRLPREFFLPTQAKRKASKQNKLERIQSIDPDYLYLVKITPRRNLYELCPPEDMQALWYFVKQNCVSRRNRVIPHLEKWALGCGPRLILNTRKPKPAKLLYKDQQSAKLPQYSHACTTISCADFFPNINIFTQFGDLSPSQMLTLFTQFRSWPEYKESSFLASLESTLLKMETSEDDAVSDIREEDDEGTDIVDMESSTNLTTTETANQQSDNDTVKTPKAKRGRKAKLT